MSNHFNHSVTFPQHPPDHPLWRDANFCPREVYQELIVPLRKQSGGAKAEQGGAKKKATGPVVKPVAEVSSAEKAQAAQKKKEAVVAPPPEAVFFGQWTEEEDELVLFQQSDQGRALSISYEDAAACLGRTSNAVKCRWHSQVKGKVETMSSEEYTLRLERGARRWFQFRKQG
ncbi:Myb-like domain-containing protein [Chloropicon primus]|uniref:Myb-like domain-containing protein n=1 Tax=Chloropicon primus TaxID=1764295 RepID=A0A5B8MKH8_9CHLO|nr:hypothetical protein A3770_04p34070 [Chloropicon primus]QDZ23078.1 hypothetical protein A3770_09p55960 [Chloropicon primus]UPR02292.1 Myb-like domain-containing protein [Chloropicon primus]|mmetsp:Transcript_3644/g.10345  ORF Transcript_3644/g.10345 Transcript_3644/m.10345 type:complete len:173 (+) Transcript_3644:126-644(+)|eukprot:QDZ20889.1 hypothetical protein A3770_04p34070 [Chloropicon primus]